MKHPDVIVIGGGMAGISAAAELARTASVLVLEAEAQIGYHATGRSAAIFIRNYGNATLRALNALAAPVFDDPGDLCDKPFASPRGELLIASEEELPALADYANGAEGLEKLSADEAVDYVPILRRDAIAAALIEPDAQDIDVDRLLQAYARRLKALGGEIVTSASLTGLHRNRGVWTVATEKGEYSAPVVVNAAGAWASGVGRMAGALDIEITPMRRSAALLPAPDGHVTDRWPLFGSVTETWYAKPETGRLMVSPADEDPVEPHDAWPDDMVLAEGLHRYETAVSVPVTRVLRSWAGLRSFAPDRTPVAGFDPQAERFFWLAGQGGYGVQTAPALARIAAALVSRQDDSVPQTLRESLGPSRFC